MTFRSCGPSPAAPWLRRPLGAAVLLVLLNACAFSGDPLKVSSNQTSSNPTSGVNAPASISAKTLLQTLTSWDGKGLNYPAGTPQVTALEITVAPGAQTGWHLHPVPSVAYILEGDLEVSLRDGTQRRFTAGQAIAEVVNTVHNGRNPGAVTTRLVVFYIGTVGQPLTLPQPQ